MSNGDDESDAPEDSDADAPEEDVDASDDAPEEEADAPDEETDAPEDAVTAFENRLSDAADDLEAAETEADLDDVESTLDAIESDLDDADLPEPEAADEADDEDGEDEEVEDPREELESRLSDLREDLEEARGPYLSDVADHVRESESTVRDTRWTHDGQDAVVDAVEEFLATVDDELIGTFETDAEDVSASADLLAEAAETMDDTDLDPDEDAAVIETLLAAAETLADALEDAEEWDDLSIREQLDHEGFYDVLDSEGRKDFPPEWSALKIHEQAGNVDQVLLALDRQDSEFMQEYVLNALKRMGPEEAYEPVHAMAKRRNHLPVQVLGKIGDERALDTLHDFIDGGDPALVEVSLRAIGEIGSEESVQPVANLLVADEPSVRSSAARTLGLLGDTRAIDPLANVLEDDDVDEVRASAAWALYQIGTERALDVASDYADDTAYLVAAEAEKAADATDAATA